MSSNARQPHDEQWANEELADLDRRRATQQRRFYGHRPKRVGNVIAQLVQRRGYAQIRAAGQREQAWHQALVAEEVEAWADSTRVAALKRGVLEIHVASSLLMQELTFCKEALLGQLQKSLPDDNIKQLKYRVANIN